MHTFGCYDCGAEVTGSGRKIAVAQIARGPGHSIARSEHGRSSRNAWKPQEWHQSLRSVGPCYSTSRPRCFGVETGDRNGVTVVANLDPFSSVVHQARLPLVLLDEINERGRPSLKQRVAAHHRKKFLKSLSSVFDVDVIESVGAEKNFFGERRNDNPCGLLFKKLSQRHEIAVPPADL